MLGDIAAKRGNETVGRGFLQLVGKQAGIWGLPNHPKHSGAASVSRNCHVPAVTHAPGGKRSTEHPGVLLARVGNHKIPAGLKAGRLQPIPEQLSSCEIHLFLNIQLFPSPLDHVFSRGA